MAVACTFFGHRHAPYSIQPVPDSSIEDLIVNKNVRSFPAGRYGDFDRMAEDSVRMFKKKYADIGLWLVTAYMPVQKDRFIYDRYDGVMYPEGLESTPKRFATVHRNRFMIDMADYCVFYVSRSWGGAAQVHSYARRHKDASCIINLADDEKSL